MAEQRRLGPSAEAGPLAEAGVGRAALLGWPGEGGPLTRWRGPGALGRHVPTITECVRALSARP